MDTVPNQLLQHFVEPVQLVIEFGSTRCATRPDQITKYVVYIGRPSLEQQLAPTLKSALYSRYLGLRGCIKDRQSIQSRK